MMKDNQVIHRSFWCQDHGKISFEALLMILEKATFFVRLND